MDNKKYSEYCAVVKKIREQMLGNDCRTEAMIEQILDQFKDEEHGMYNTFHNHSLDINGWLKKFSNYQNLKYYLEKEKIEMPDKKQVKNFFLKKIKKELRDLKKWIIAEIDGCFENFAKKLISEADEENYNEYGHYEPRYKEFGPHENTNDDDEDDEE